VDGTVALGAGVIEADLMGGGLRSSSLVAAADVGVRVGAFLGQAAEEHDRRAGVNRSRRARTVSV
jgi:hypothetical protein